MSLDTIKQNMKTIAEVADFYNDLVEQKSKADKKKAKEMDFKIENTRSYILKLTAYIKNLIEKEKQVLQKNA